MANRRARLIPPLSQGDREADFNVAPNGVAVGSNDTPEELVHVEDTQGNLLVRSTDVTKSSNARLMANPGSAGNAIAQFRGEWGPSGSETLVGFLRIGSGADTVNKDDGRGEIYTTEGGSFARRLYILESGEVAVGALTPVYLLDVGGEIGMTERSSDPANPAEGRTVRWLSDGTSSGDDGDVLEMTTAGGSTWTSLISPRNYAGISVVGNSTQTTVSGTVAQVTIFDTNNPSFISTPDHTQDHITPNRNGDYLIHCSATVNSVAGPASRFEMTVEKNNGATLVSPALVARNIAGGGGNSGSVSMLGPATLASSDTIEVWIDGPEDYVVENIALVLIRKGI